jgi:hypothetical protein
MITGGSAEGEEGERREETGIRAEGINGRGKRSNGGGWGGGAKRGELEQKGKRGR